MEDKIAIIEGPPPTFKVSNEQWILGLNESPKLENIVVTHLRTFNGPALVERCYRAWSKGQSIHLEFRASGGYLCNAPIAAARYVETGEGHVLLLWVRLKLEDMEFIGDVEAGGDSKPGDDFDQPDLL
ncbi:MAG: hypothetical protein AB1345_00450 [Chloroflexota bacterium]